MKSRTRQSYTHGEKIGDVRVQLFVGATSLESFLSHGGNRVLGDRVIGPILIKDEEDGEGVTIHAAPPGT